MNRREKDSYEFFALLGYCITHWAHIDRVMFDLCKITLGASDKKTAIVFYQSPSIRNHLNLVDRLLRNSTGHEISSRQRRKWTRIFSELEVLISFRNDIAHYPVTQIYILEGSPDPEHRKSGGPFWEIHTEQYKLIAPSRNTKVVKWGFTDLSDHLKKTRRVLKSLSELARDLQAA